MNTERLINVIIVLTVLVACKTTDTDPSKTLSEKNPKTQKMLLVFPVLKKKKVNFCLYKTNMIVGKDNLPTGKLKGLPNLVGEERTINPEDPTEIRPMPMEFVLNSIVSLQEIHERISVIENSDFVNDGVLTRADQENERELI